MTRFPLLGAAFTVAAMCFPSLPTYNRSAGATGRPGGHADAIPKWRIPRPVEMKSVSVDYVASRDELLTQVKTHLLSKPLTALAYLDESGAKLLSPRDRAVLTQRAVQSLARQFRPDSDPVAAIQDVREARYRVSGLDIHADSELAALEAFFFAELVLRQVPKICHSVKDRTSDVLEQDARRLASVLRDSSDLRGDAKLAPYDGVGLQIGEDDEGRFVITRVVPDGPAHRAGVLPGDVLDRLDGKPIESKLWDEVHAALRGPRGTKVTLTLIRPKRQAALNVEVTRDTVLAKETSLIKALDDIATASAMVTSYEKLQAALARVRAKYLTDLELRTPQDQAVVEILERISTHEGILTNVWGKNRKEHGVKLHKGDSYFFEVFREIGSYGCPVHLEDLQRKQIVPISNGYYQVEQDGEYRVVVETSYFISDGPGSSRFEERIKYTLIAKRREVVPFFNPRLVTELPERELGKYLRRMSVVSELREAVLGDIRPATVVALTEHLKAFRELGGNAALADRMSEELAVRVLLAGHFKEARLLVPPGGPSEHAAYLLSDLKAILTGKGEVVTDPGRAAVAEHLGGGGKRQPPPSIGLLLPEGPANEWKPRINEGVLASLPPLAETLGRQQLQWQEEHLQEPRAAAHRKAADAARVLDAIHTQYLAQADRLTPFQQALAFRLQQPLTTRQQALARDQALRGHDAETVARELESAVSPEEISFPTEALVATRFVAAGALGANSPSGFTLALDISFTLGRQHLAREWAKTVKLK
jgi:hypothetical protein